MITPPPAIAGAPLEIHRTLIVEDIPETRLWLHDMLRNAFPPGEADSVGSVADALTALARQRYDLALVDIGLPDGSGIEVLTACRAQPHSPQCVVTTVFDDDQHLFAALRAGASGYLLKDHPADELAISLRGIVDGQPPLSPPVARRLLGFFSAVDDEGGTPLAPREREVLSLIAKGCTVNESARLLGLSSYTVASYVKDIYRKLHVNNRAEATLEAMRRGLV